MKKLLLIAILWRTGALACPPVCTFEEILNRVEQAHAIPQSALDAAASLEQPLRKTLPTVRAEMTLGSTGTLVAVDYPLFDGGQRDAQAREARIDAAAFRERARMRGAALFRDTVDAVARLYAAQERLRVVDAGLQRAIAMRGRAKQLLALQEMSNATAAQWEDQSIAAESQLLGLQLQRLEAETQVKQLMGDESSEAIEITLQLDSNGGQAPRPSGQAGAPALQVQRKQLALEQAEAARRPQLFASAFGGVAALGDRYFVDDRRRYGLYGIRFSLALPMLDAAGARRVAEARLEAEEAAMNARDIDDSNRKETAMLQLEIAAQEKRIDLLRQAVAVSKQREESVVRLVAAGVRSESQLAEAAVESAGREGDLLAARIEMWKLQQLLAAAR